MSFVQPSTVHAIAQSLEVGAVSDEAAKALSPDVEVSPAGGGAGDQPLGAA